METHFAAFDGPHLLGEGPLAELAPTAQTHLTSNPTARLLFFDADSGHQIEVDLRGSPEEVRARYAAHEPPSASPAEPFHRGPGRPKLGVTAHEVTLLPRHWAWLAGQPGGASGALRRLVETAMNDPEIQARDRRRERQAAAYRFMSSLGGDLPGFEAASRALFAGDRAGFLEATAAWPYGVRDLALRLAGEAIEPPRG